MERYSEMKGDLISLALDGAFEVIVHGCNCFCKQQKGIAPQMAKAFGTDKFDKEGSSYVGDYDKLGCIDYRVKLIDYDKNVWEVKEAVILRSTKKSFFSIVVVNAYTQYNKRKNAEDTEIHFDYEAFAMCLKKINWHFKDKHVGLPKIGSGLAGGDWERIKELIQKYMTDCYVTVIEYSK